jgi:tetratricopeptide (TPR) repeat protein
MGLISFRRTGLVPLLFLLLIGATAAAPSAESLYRQAHATFRRGDMKAAGILASEALRRFAGSDDPWVWKLRFDYANVLMNQNNAAAARELLQRALPEQLAGTELEVLRLQGLAMANKRLRDPHGEELIAQAYELAKKKHPRTLPMLLVYRATIDDRNKGKWAREALRLARQYGDADAELRARSTLATDLANHQRFDEAIAMWEPAVVQASKVGDLMTVQRLEGSLGWAYLELGDYENAADFLMRAHGAAEKLGGEYESLIWTYQLGNIRLQQGDLAAAGKHYRTALEIATRTGHSQLPIVLANMASYELKAGHLADAQRYCDESLRARKAAKDVEGELRSLLLAGRIATAAGKLAEGERLLNDVVARTASNATKAEAHGRLAQLYVKSGDFGEATDHFGQYFAEAREARNNITDRELRLSFFAAVEELYDSYVDFLIARRQIAPALAATESSRAETLEEGTDSVAPPDMRVIARDTRATVLCYWLGETNSYMWLVTPNSVEAIRLPPKRTIEAAIDDYQADLLGAYGTLRLSGARGTALWKMLVAPAAPSIAPGSRVIVVPHGRLAAFNFETLVVPTPTPHYWIEDVVVSTAGSLALLARNEPRSAAAPRLLLVGNPPPPLPEFVALPHAGEEMEKVASHFDAKRSLVLRGAKATPSAYRAAPPEAFTYLHFVAHGVANRLKPLDSAVVLAREGDTFKLYARDIAKQPLTARLVTISSCHGAGTRTYAGEGLVGLGWAFLRAGAENVVAALWDVNDEATAKLMDRFYGSLAKNIDPATALRDAKLSLLRGEGKNVRPYYWAPFLLYGRS